MTTRDPAIRIVLLPRDTNERGTIFGGVILSQLDLAAAVEVGNTTSKRCVTVAMKEVVFKEPVYVGDVVSFYTSTERIGNTSITVKVEVEARRRHDPGVVVKVTEATVVYVTVDDEGRPIPVRKRASGSRQQATAGGGRQEKKATGESHRRPGR